jgi:pyruvate,water dikinase
MGRIRRTAFRRLLADAQQWVTLRETTKSLVVRAARMSEFVLPEMQQRLVAKGVIEASGDIYFLTREEIAAALTTGPAESLASRVARRKRELERSRYLTLPERFRGRPSPVQPALPDGGSGALHGTPVSPGIVTGRARVLQTPAACNSLQPGEILVAPVTDAGWTPLFALASGLVVDLGSALSHGSTVAREYGLPAVVNVRNATRVIHDGDLVTVNGTTGDVFVGDDVDGRG